ncbi:hypothetical protein MKY96_32755 [Paenibacillus sp. FSL R7-0302]|uniref:DUF6915 family protein n=1 Tax=Paenibacillus sp. FSL R7-0302 TaxID=2921681 RepID=UPI0030F7A7F3
MAHPYVHAENSAKRFGGKPEDYLAIHEWFDATKAWYPEMTHRSMRHHSEGIYECAALFGETFINSDGKRVYTRYVGEQHVVEDLKFIPTASDWLECMDMQLWMMNRSKRLSEKVIERKHGFPDRMPSSVSPPVENRPQGTVKSF